MRADRQEQNKRQELKIDPNEKAHPHPPTYPAGGRKGVKVLSPNLARDSEMISPTRLSKGTLTERLAMRHVRDVIRMKAAGPTRFAASKLSRQSARDEHVMRAPFRESGLTQPSLLAT